jgi:hypothetical protein
MPVLFCKSPLNEDVVAIIKSYAGVTLLDVADAVRALHREGVHATFARGEMRHFSKLCFMIKQKFAKEDELTHRTVRNELQYEHRLSQTHYLLAFKVMGFDYKVDAEGFWIRARLNVEKWCDDLKPMIERQDKEQWDAFFAEQGRHDVLYECIPRLLQRLRADKNLRLHYELKLIKPLF